MYAWDRGAADVMEFRQNWADGDASLVSRLGECFAPKRVEWNDDDSGAHPITPANIHFAAAQ
jgi:hypothetical protein